MDMLKHTVHVCHNCCKMETEGTLAPTFQYDRSQKDTPLEKDTQLNMNLHALKGMKVINHITFTIIDV